MRKIGRFLLVVLTAFLTIQHSDVFAQALNVTIDDRTWTCHNGKPSERFVASATGGTSPYNYAWHDENWGFLTWTSSGEFWPTSFGTYHVVAWDDSSNTDTASITIVPSPLNMQVNLVEVASDVHTTCNKNDGQIEVEISGGTPPYRVIVRMTWQSAVEALELPSDTVFEEYTSVTSITVDSLYPVGYQVTVVSDSGRACSYEQMVELEAFDPLIVKLSGELYPNGHYVSCDTCSDAVFTIQTQGETGDVDFAWLKFNAELDPEILINNATLALRYEWKDDSHGPQGESDYVDAMMAYGPDQATMDSLPSESWYFGLAIDENGCMDYSALYIEKPRPPAGAWRTDGNEADSTMVLGTVNDEALHILTNDTVRMGITPSGQVGIGTETVPDGFLLAVNGKVIAEEVEVRLQGDWPDFVFDENYYLMPTDSLRRFIRRNGHLPGFASARNMQERGSVASGHTLLTLVQKVEELTLYMLQQEKRIEALEEQNRELFRQSRDVHKEMRQNRVQSQGNGNGNGQGGNPRNGNQND